MKTSIPFPTEVLDQHTAVLGKTGAGKSSAVRVVVEHLLNHNKRVCVIDPKGDWWGLKVSADGKEAGYPVITFGDFKGDYEADVPLNKESGKHVAELITSGNRPAIIGFRGWFTSDMLKFWIDFAKTLFHSNEGELFLIMDEAQNFAPKGSLKSIEGQGGTALHWTNRLLAEGRGLGINIWVCSQRPQKVHNDTLDGCETLVAMRVVHPAARGAIKDWIDGAEDKEKGKQVLDKVGEMKRGDAIIWSPEIGFGPKHVTFPLFTTFDSFAPRVEVRHNEPFTVQPTARPAIKRQPSVVIAATNGDAPTGGMRRIMVALAQRPGLSAKQIGVRAGLSSSSGTFGTYLGRLRSNGWVEGSRDAMQLTQAGVESLGSYDPLPSGQSLYEYWKSELGNSGASRILQVLFEAYPEALTKAEVGERANISHTSGTFGTYLGKLRTLELVTGSGELKASPEFFE